MNAQHTQGPWNLHQAYIGDQILTAKDGNQSWEFRHLPVAQGEKIVAVAQFSTSENKGFPSVDCHDEMLANARLIAAAPELLEAVKVAREVLVTAIRANWEGATDEDISDHITIKRLDAAIDKATGGQQ